MSDRVIVTLHLPLEMGAFGRILKAIARDYPDARMGENGQVTADDDVRLTQAQRRAIVRERERAHLPVCVRCGDRIPWGQLDDKPEGSVHRVCPRDVRRARISARKGGRP
jgi:hypothetical protein